MKDYILGIFNEDSKISSTRIMSMIAFWFAILLAIVQIFIVKDLLPLVYAFLSFAGGTKVIGKFAEKKK